MLKFVQLTLAKIKYSGDSIGDDICIEVEALGKFLRIDKRIKIGTTSEINREIGRFETDHDQFEAKVSINVIEKDLIFNDVGFTVENIRINTNNNEKQEFIFKVEIGETRSIFGKIWGKSVAVFEITLESKMYDAICYVSENIDGWLRVVLESDKSKINLPAFLKVKINNIDRKREYFTILEGAYRGKSASVVLRANGSSNFLVGVKHDSAAVAKYSISEKVFILDEKKYKAADYPEKPWKKGSYDIEIPDYPHSGGTGYLALAPKARVWFKIGHSGERYLHTGSRSLGCITIVEKNFWSEIYNKLIKARKGDFVSVGVLEVVD